jgi:hypothetical protein
MVLALMPLLVRLEVSAGLSARTVRTLVRLARLNQSGFDAESHGLEQGSAGHPSPIRQHTYDEPYARDRTEGDNKT